MNLSHRARRDWRIFLWVSVLSATISACFAYLNNESGGSWLSAVEGIATSLAIATPLLLFELRRDRIPPLRRLRRLPLALYFAIKVLFYALVIVSGLLLMRYGFAGGMQPLVRLDIFFRRALVFSIGMSLAVNLIFEFGGLLGFGTLKNLLTGRYVQPRHEQRVFLLIDMKDSTGLAERLGPVLFHELLNEFFRDITDAALECGAEIHKYVGDEAILTWPADSAFEEGDCLACPFVARGLIARHGKTYRERFGAVPEFRAALHFGEIVAGEIGDVRREITYVGDTLNVAARLLDAAKTLGREVLVSSDLLEHARLPTGLEVEKLPTLNVRGRAAPLAIAALSSVSAAP